MYIVTKTGLVTDEQNAVITERVREYQYHESELLNVLLDDVLPELALQLSIDAQAKLNAILATRQEIKQRYPKPA